MMEKFLGVLESAISPQMLLNRNKENVEKCSRKKRQNNIPTSFDVRQRWPQCAQQIDNIRTQVCSSCWAISVGGMLTDRRCIQKAKYNQTIEPAPFEISSADILACSGAGTYVD